jgi:hypothetical protein
MADDTSNPAHASDAELVLLAQAAQLLTDLENRLAREINQLPPQLQGAARDELAHAIGGARQSIAQSGAMAVLAARAAVQEVSSAVEQKIAQAQHSAAGVKIVENTMEAVLNAPERLALQNRLSLMMADDGIFGKLDKQIQQHLVEMTTDYIAGDPILAAQVKAQEAMPEKTALVEQGMRNDQGRLYGLMRSPEMEPFRERLANANGRLFGTMPPKLQLLLHEYHDGKIAPEAFVTQMEAISEQMQPAILRAKQWAVKRLESDSRGAPIAKAFNEYMGEHHQTLETYSANPRIDQNRLLLAMDHWKEKGLDLEKLPKEERQLIARYMTEKTIAANMQINMVSQGLALIQAKDLGPELMGKSPEEKAQYMVDHGALNPALKDEAVLLFTGLDDSQLFTKGALYTKGLEALVTRNVTQSLTKSEERQFSKEIDRQLKGLDFKNISPEVMAEFDSNKDGKINIDEFKNTIKKHGIEMKDVDQNNSHHAEPGEALQLMQKVARQTGKGPSIT